jgi:actin cytoskeleton-regulatory complex protein SLA1
VREWTDRTGTFSVEAQFLGIKDGKLNLHKMNGVKIAVPVSKMSLKDLEYVERVTGLSLDEDKPLSELKKKNGDLPRSSGQVGATIEQPKKSDYDWFQFFLSCDVQVGVCERYAQAFSRDSMDESVLPDVDASVLRNLGLREGDIIKVMRFLDAKYGRTKKAGGGEEGEGGLFSGPGGTLRNNTRKGRPAPPVETSNVVDPKAFSAQTESEERTASPAPAAPQAAATSAPSKPAGGFDDDAWSVKPAKKAPEPASSASAPAPAPAPAPAAPKPAALTGSMQELSLLTQPLQPEKVQPQPTALPALNLAPAPAPAPVAPTAPQMPQPTGVTPQFFAGMQPPAVNGQQLPQALARQRPMAPQYTQGQAGLMPPPPARPLSAPQSAQPSSFTPPPLQPQMTGYPTQVAPPGQSLNDIAQARLQQQYTAMQMQAQAQQPQQIPMMPMMTGMPAQQGFPNQFIPQPTGIMNGPQPMQSPFANPPAQQQQFGQMPMQSQPTGFGFGQQPQQPQGFGVNSFLPPPLEPQRTAVPQMMPQPTGFGGGFGQPAAQQQPQPTGFGMQPLVPQQTGPPPPVRFGVSADAKKLAPQPTGRRANLSAASKYPAGSSAHPLPKTWLTRYSSSSKPLRLLTLRATFQPIRLVTR